jgi:hypothetical protein
MNARELAVALRTSERTVRRWLAAWLALGVEGVELVPAANSRGAEYRVARSLVARWKRGLLPAPRMPRAAQAA